MDVVKAMRSGNKRATLKLALSKELTETGPLLRSWGSRVKYGRRVPGHWDGDGDGDPFKPSRSDEAAYM